MTARGGRRLPIESGAIVFKLRGLVKQCTMRKE
jgi:hypothetical protein